ncbi:MAG: hypothetical protein CVU49_09375 [Candidatus Cloacimonetes bacterium HGW-Cloacimonetes-2]|jgi:hypothetical protein|nr:MAG: hypothetical protein CVU49_09375 [Candidatus Cloacimonetes bacterium HGW-Cloacimonetes-2]
MKRIIITLATLLLLAPLFSGRYAGDFMSIGAGVRALGMGGAYSAIASDCSAIYWNTAGIAQMKKAEVSAMHAFLYEGLAAYDNVAYCQPLPNEVTIGINITRLSVDDIPYFDESYLIGTNVDQRINDSAYHLPGVPDGKFKSTDDLFQFAFAKLIHYDANMGWLFFEVPFDIALGGNIKYIKRSLHNQLGTGTGFDFGVLVKTDMGVVFDMDELGDISFGVNFQDISGTNINWDTATEHSDEILFNTKFGIAIEQPIPSLKSALRLAYDYDYVYEGTQHFGAEWEYDDLAWLRLGYYDKNFSCGASVKLYGVNLDYALITNPVGLSNRIGLRMNF